MGAYIKNTIDPKRVIPPSFQCNLNNSLFLQPTCPSDIEHVINNLNSKKSIPLGHVPIKFIKMSSSIISTYLSNIFNYCISSGVYPDTLKIAQITPIHKTGSYESAQTTDQYPCSLELMKCLKNFFMIDYTVT